ncbi:MAG: hypothetical protein KatS3mg009_0408 [Acidimicrobiia bacterium]|nr:MAG: hypothetical protein KatS3mg009_0408 [Acidimicrobiia bacterium]
MSRAVAEPAAARRWWPVAAIALVALVLAAVIAVVLVAADEANDPRRVTVRIPEGTADAVADGREPGVVEERIVLRAGDELELRNDDTRLHVLGPLSVAPGGTARTVFAEPARTDMATSLRADGIVTIVVQSAGAASSTAGTTGN